MLFNDIFIFCSVMPQLQWFHMEYGMTPLTRKNSGKSNAHCTYWICLKTKKRSGAGYYRPISNCYTYVYLLYSSWTICLFCICFWILMIFSISMRFFVLTVNIIHTSLKKQIVRRTYIHVVSLHSKCIPRNIQLHTDLKHTRQTVMFILALFPNNNT